MISWITRDAGSRQAPNTEGIRRGILGLDDMVVPFRLNSCFAKVSVSLLIIAMSNPCKALTIQHDAAGGTLSEPSYFFHLMEVL